jgi:hypothetical protein
LMAWAVRTATTKAHRTGQTVCSTARRVCVRRMRR